MGIMEKVVSVLGFVDREEETVILEKGQKQVTFQRK